MILFTDYSVAAKDNSRMVTTPQGMTYVDRLFSWRRMAEIERIRQGIHNTRAHEAKDQTVREWRFRLRNNCYRRRGIYMSKDLNS